MLAKKRIRSGFFRLQQLLLEAIFRRLLRPTEHHSYGAAVSQRPGVRGWAFCLGPPFEASANTQPATLASASQGEYP
jgi:hypothetical protein